MLSRKNWIVYQYTTRVADVYPYNTSYTPIKNIAIVTGASIYTDNTGITYIIIIHEALFYGDKLYHSLLKSNQIRTNHVNYWDSPYDNLRHLSIEAPNTLVIPLDLDGTNIQFELR